MTSNKIRPSTLLTAIAVALGLLALPASASAATIVGSTGTPTDVFSGDDNHTLLQDLDSGENGADYVSPVSGVITQWSSAANATAGRSHKLLIVRNDDADDDWDVIGRDTQARVLANPSALNIFTGIHLRINAGDQLALYTPDGQPGGKSSATYNTAPTPEDVVRPVVGAEPGATIAAGGISLLNTRLNVAATVEPDADGDLFGDETQDGCPMNAAVQTACPAPPVPPGAEGKKCPKGKKLKKKKGKKKCVKKKRKKKK